MTDLHCPAYEMGLRVKSKSSGGLLRERFSDIEPGTVKVKAIRQAVEEGKGRLAPEIPERVEKGA